MKRFCTIGAEEFGKVREALKAPLSGYLAGGKKGGKFVQELEETFAGMIGSKHAVAVNSATSGLLAACYASKMNKYTKTLVSPYTMSATAVAPYIFDSMIYFDDIDEETFGLSLPEDLSPFDQVIITHLFGNPNCQFYNIESAPFIIEDCAQAIFASVNGRHVGTLGDIGVFSFNVHKHLQAGEGGICTTDDYHLAHDMRMFMNHGEVNGHGEIGLNLRMTEITAAICLAQLGKAESIISSRIELGEEITDMVRSLGWIRPPRVLPGCRHVYYAWAGRLNDGVDRHSFINHMQASGIPFRAGYMSPLYTIPFLRIENTLPAVEKIESSLVLFECCAWDPNAEDLKSMREAFKTFKPDRYAS